MKRISLALIAIILLAASVSADSIDDLQAAKAKLEKARDTWQAESQKYRDRLAEKRAQLEAVERTPELREKLAADAVKAAKDTMKDAAKDIPSALGNNDAKKAKEAVGLIKDMLKMRDAEQKLDAVDTAMLDGTIEKQEAALKAGITDLQNKVAIYDAYISGANTAVNTIDTAIAQQRNAQWSAWVNNLAAAVAGAQQRVNDRHAAEQRAAAERAAAERRASQRDRPEHDHDRPERPKADQKPETRAADNKPDTKSDSKPEKSGGKKDSGVEIHMH